MDTTNATFASLRIRLPEALIADHENDANTVIDLLADRATQAITAGNAPSIHKTLGDVSRLRRIAEQAKPGWEGLRQMEALISKLEIASDAVLARRQAKQPFNP